MINAEIGELTQKIGKDNNFKGGSAVMRLDKLITTITPYTRSQAKALLKKKAVVVDGAVVKDGKVKVDETAVEVAVEGVVYSYSKHRYYMLNKPLGVVSATKDASEPTALALLAKRVNTKGLFLVGRLDKQTSGLLLICDDGKLSHALLAPTHHVAKRYVATLAGVVDAGVVARFAAGMTLKNGEECAPADLQVLAVDEANQTSKATVVLHEGKYHQVRRMFAANGLKVLALHRAEFGPLTLDEDLKPGDFRALREEEIAALKKAAG